MPELYLLALAQYAITADIEVVILSNTSFDLLVDWAVDVTIVASAFRPVPMTNCNSTLTPSANLSHQTLATLECLLLFSLSREACLHVRQKIVNTICDLQSNQDMVRQPWHALKAQAFSMIHTQGPSLPI